MYLTHILRLFWVYLYPYYVCQYIYLFNIDSVQYYVCEVCATDICSSSLSFSLFPNIPLYEWDVSFKLFMHYLVNKVLCGFFCYEQSCPCLHIYVGISWQYILISRIAELRHVYSSIYTRCSSVAVQSGYTFTLLLAVYKSSHCSTASQILVFSSF